MGAGSTKNTRDSQSKRLGLKCSGSQKVKAGHILMRQRGAIFKAGENVGCGRDYTLYALKTGTVDFTTAGFISVVINFVQ